MDQFPGTQDGGSPERVREGQDTKTQLYRNLAEGALRLQTATTADRTLTAAADVIRSVLGPVPALIVFKEDGGERRHSIGAREPDDWNQPHVDAALRKAMESEHPVVEGQGLGRGIAVRLAGDRGAVGTLYVGVSELERRFGHDYMDVLQLVGRHVGAALERTSAPQREGEGEGGATVALPTTLSLREAKKYFERQLVEARLKEARGNIAAAARSLDMDRGQLSRLLKKHGVDKTNFRPLPGGARKNPGAEA